MQLKKILVIDDCLAMQRKWAAALEGKVVLLSALTIPQADMIFAAHPDIAAVAVDACVPGRKPNTHGLVRRMRISFQGPMVAISGSQQYRIELLSAGCDHSSRKDLLPEKVLEVLNLS